jgi:hypothetical protein
MKGLDRVDQSDKEMLAILSPVDEFSIFDVTPASEGNKPGSGTSSTGPLVNLVKLEVELHEMSSVTPLTTRECS